MPSINLLDSMLLYSTSATLSRVGRADPVVIVARSARERTGHAARDRAPLVTAAVIDGAHAINSRTRTNSRTSSAASSKTIDHGGPVRQGRCPSLPTPVKA
jgi:hypothetical protein